jgi:hypothetical protein
MTQRMQINIRNKPIGFMNRKYAERKQRPHLANCGDPPS